MPKGIHRCHVKDIALTKAMCKFKVLVKITLNINITRSKILISNDIKDLDTLDLCIKYKALPLISHELLSRLRFPQSISISMVKDAGFLL